MIRINYIVKNKIYWQNMADRINKKDMSKIYCKKCNGNDCYKQEEENINWIHCPNCGFKERVKHYFNKDNYVNNKK